MSKIQTTNVTANANGSSVIGGSSSTATATNSSDSCTPNHSGSTTPAVAPLDDSFTEPVVPPQFVGHLGHLTTAQSESFDTFKELLAKEGVYQPSTGSKTNSDLVEASHDDVTLLRFLRARSFQPPAAVTQFKRAEEWRKEQDVDSLFATGFTAEELDIARRFYPRWTGRRDKQGLPLFVYRISALEALQKELDPISSKRRYQRIVLLYELMCRFTLPLCSALPHPTSPHPISCTTNIIDLGDASFSLMFRLRGLFQEASKLATPYYPETLGTIIVVNAPSFFPTIWSWIKGWFDEGTRHKIHILGADPTATLLTLIDTKDLPEIYGGELDWSFFDRPNLDDASKAALPDGQIPPGVIVYKDGKVRRSDGTEL